MSRRAILLERTFPFETETISRRIAKKQKMQNLHKCLNRLGFERERWFQKANNQQADVRFFGDVAVALTFHG